MQLICNVHGISDHSKRVLKNKKSYLEQERWICKKCDYISSRTYISNLKLKAIKYGGGECQQCGYDKCWRALHFHHVDPNKKDFAIFEFRQGNKKVRNWERLKVEIDKCILLCSNCHTEIHDLDNKLSLEKENKYKLPKSKLYYLNKSILQGLKTAEEIFNVINQT